METEGLWPPDQQPCWEGSWTRPSPAQEFWTLAADSRTISALPRLHPWRLADVKGARRVLVWLGVRDCALAALTHTATEPRLATDERSYDAFLPPPSADPIQQRWLSAYVEIAGAWMPTLAILPRGLRDFDDPGTRWSTESTDFAERHTVHAGNTRYAADVLAPHVMALILDEFPSGAAITMAGDALHAWLPYTPTISSATGLASQLAMATTRLRNAIPGFVFADYPNRSDVVEGELAAREHEAFTYRANRKLGTSNDPTLQRIYAQARAAWEAGHVSSGS